MKCPKCKEGEMNYEIIESGSDCCGDSVDTYGYRCTNKECGHTEDEPSRDCDADD